jgi:hypothetical protein
MIQWEDGNVTFRPELIRRLLQAFDVVHTKGLEKKMFLSRYHGNVRDIEGPALRAKFNGYCRLSKHRSEDTKCALRSATLYYEYLNFMLNVEPMDVD